MLQERQGPQPGRYAPGVPAMAATPSQLHPISVHSTRTHLGVGLVGDHPAGLFAELQDLVQRLPRGCRADRRAYKRCLQKVLSTA